MALDTAEEVLRVGRWSIRKVGRPRRRGGEHCLIYFDLSTGRAQAKPPQEVLTELGLEADYEEEGELEEEEEDVSGNSRPRRRRGCARGHPPGEGMGKSGGGGSPPQSPLFRRVVLGSGCEVPITMARDILDALREDAELFEDVQLRFSDYPAEVPFQLGGGLPEAVQSAALELRVEEVSDIISTDAGVQILKRVA